MNVPAVMLLDLDIYTLAKVPRRQVELLPDVGGLYFALDGAQLIWSYSAATRLALLRPLCSRVSHWLHPHRLTALGQFLT